MRAVLVTLLLLLAGVAVPANAAVIHQPANGATVQMGTSLYFDWAWDADEYWTDRIIFTQVADPNDPIWVDGDKPGKIRVTANYGTGWGESHATVSFTTQQWGFTPGTWYWRLCNKSINGEDDKCYIDPEVRSLNITPTAACADGIDNDLDGATDLADLACTSPTGTSEGPPPQCFDGVDNDGDGATDTADEQCESNRDRREALDPMPKLTYDKARGYMRTALRRKFNVAYRHGYAKKLSRCTRLSPTRVKCRRVSWAIGDLGYDGWATIWLSRDAESAVWWNYAYRITRTNWYCVDQGRKRCTKVYRVG